MFVKLMKHEILSSYRKFLPIYLAVIVLSIITPLTRQFNSMVLMSSLMSISMLMAGVVFFFTLYTIIINLGQRVFGKPGYLLFTTPATTTQIIAAKSIVNIMWLIISGIVGLIAVSSFIVVVFWSDLLPTVTAIGGVISDYPFEILTGIVGLFTYSFYVIGMLFFLFALLNMIYKGEKKILFGVLLYFVISQGTGMVAAIFIGAYSTFVETLFTSVSDIWVFVALYAILGSVLYVLTYLIIEKKLEIQ